MPSLGNQPSVKTLMMVINQYEIGDDLSCNHLQVHDRYPVTGGAKNCYGQKKNYRRIIVM